MQRLGPTKKRKRKSSECVECFGHWTVFMRWTVSGLCTELWVTLELIHKGVSFTQQISSLVLICDAKTWSHKKEEKEMQWVCQVFRPLDCLYTLNREWTLYKRWVTKSWHSKESDCHPKNPFLSLKSVMKRLGPPKEEEKELQWVSLNVLATGLSLCAEQKVDFVQEMGG